MRRCCGWRSTDVETDRAMAVSIDGNGRRVACDPYVGAAEAVCECAANLACVGAEPLGLTNCLNFGNPEKPHVAWQLTRAVGGMAAACRALDVPVVGGNVSLYNEGAEGPIYPTPVVGMVGELPDVRRAGTSAFAAGRRTRWSRSWARSRPRCSAPSWRGWRGAWRAGSSPSTCARCARRSSSCAKPCATGAVDQRARRLRRRPRGGVTESALQGGVGATLDLEPLMRRAEVDARTALFGEGPGGIVVSGPRDALLELSATANAAGVGFLALGTVGGAGIAIAAGTARIDISLEDAGSLFESALAERLS